VQIQQQVIQRKGGQRREEILPAGILLNPEAPGSEQAAKRLAHLRLVIEYSNYWLCSWHRTESLEEIGEAVLLDLS